MRWTFFHPFTSKGTSGTTRSISLPTCNMSHDLVFLPSSPIVLCVTMICEGGESRICMYTNFLPRFFVNAAKDIERKAINFWCKKSKELGLLSMCWFTTPNSKINPLLEKQNAIKISRKEWREIENLLKHYSSHYCEIIFSLKLHNFLSLFVSLVGAGDVYEPQLRICAIHNSSNDGSRAARVFMSYFHIIAFRFAQTCHKNHETWRIVSSPLLHETLWKLCLVKKIYVCTSWKYIFPVNGCLAGYGSKTIGN